MTIRSSATNETSDGASIESPVRAPITVATAMSRTADTSIAGLAIILVAASLACLWLCWSTVHIEKLWLQNYGFFFDPAAYYVMNIEILTRLEHQGLVPTLLAEILDNPRCPARTVPYLLLCPQLLSTLMGHMWSEMPLVWGFLTLFCMTVYKRTASLFFALAASATFVALPMLYNPFYGLAAYWLDIPAACAIGLASLCLIRYLEDRHLGWMAAFGAFSALTALCRWSATFYLLAFLSFAVPIAIIARPTRAYFRHTTIATVLALLLATPGIAFAVRHLPSNVGYYQRNGYAFGATLSQSFAWTGFALQEMIGVVLLVLFAFLVVRNALLMWRCSESVDERRITLIALWYPISILLFVCVIVKAVDGYHPLVYIAPALMVAAFCPLNRVPVLCGKAAICSIALLALSVALSAHSYKLYWRMANLLHAAARLDRELDQKLAMEIASAGCDNFAQLDAERCMPLLELFYNQHRRVRFEALFSIHEAYLKSRYPNHSPATMGKVVYAKANATMPLLAVFATPSDARKPGMFDNPYSAEVAFYISQQIKDDPTWEFRKTISGPRADLSIYINRNLQAAQ